MHSLLESIECSPIRSSAEESGRAKLDEFFAGLRADSPVKILLLNATKGVQYFPSIVDYFVALSKAVPSVQVTSSSYFEETYEYGRGVREKGLKTLSIESLSACSVRQLNLLDFIVAVGPSSAFVELRAKKGLTAKLILMDLAFYHQLEQIKPGQQLTTVQFDSDAASENSVICYSCQPYAKVLKDLRNAGIDTSEDRWSWRWFSYIPIGYRYRKYYRANRRLFDVAFLGANNRDYEALDKESLRGKKILFIGASQYTETLRESFADLDITYLEKVEEDTYFRLLSTCRCIVLPYQDWRKNCFLSVLDALAMGIPLLVSEHEGIQRLKDRGAPFVLFTAENFGTLLERTIGDGERWEERHRASMDFCERELDIRRILMRLTAEELFSNAPKGGLY